MQTNNFTEELQNRLEFFVDVRKVVEENGNIGIIINYENREEEVYVLKISDIITYVGYSCKGMSEAFMLPNSSLRIYIFLNLVKKMNEKELPYAAIRFFDENNNRVENIQKLLLPPADEKDLISESLLDKAFNQAFKDKEAIPEIEEELRKQGLYHAFSLMKGLLI